MNVIVVGGGAAGMMAAISAAEKGHTVELLERNEKLGKKIYITGKGRCNVTNACDLEEFFTNIVSNEKFLYSSIYQYDNNAVIDFFESNGCPLKVERGNRVFPVSDHASDVTKALADKMKSLGVKITFYCKVEDLIIKEDGSIGGVVTNKKERKIADRVILATGGFSYEPTGSDGSGVRILEKYGHKIAQPKPALVPFELKEDYGARLQGLALKNVNFFIKDGKKKIYDGFGEMLFTHFGISGPLVISASSYYVKKLYGKEVKCYIDLKPALTEEQLDKRILREFEENKNKQFKNSLDKLFPAKLVPLMVELSGINPDKKVNEVTKEERKTLVHLIKNWEMTITGTRGFREAIITQGGVAVKGVNPSTMESKVIPGLYIAGEMLDIDALTGGFNLQLAWSTGYLAGNSIE
ncbi:MAG: NAD(P)/FAD-dependent oxidoreductase [Lachnospiraceae bacterium]|nr:NAD(P)/FAD-dependent oxidoreductase [Lachnospiraceae bacterium]